jgi:nitrite reductase/ring-hydroxylating ferredoxin subunit
MGEHFVKATSADAIAPGGMKAFTLEGQEIVICNCGGAFHAVQRRCGHMNAPLELGTLDGTILTCAMHCAQFDVLSGQALSGPVPADLGPAPLPPRFAKLMHDLGLLMKDVKTERLRTYQTKLEAGWVWLRV